MRYLLRQSPLDGGIADEPPPAVPAAGVEDDEDARRAAARRALIRRPAPTGDSTEVTRVLALDCEMVGVGAFGSSSKLASVAIVNEYGNEVYFSYAKPPVPVTDYRTWVSGIEPRHLDGAPPFLRVQQEVRQLLAGRVIVGHSLVNDFKVRPSRTSHSIHAHARCPHVVGFASKLVA